MYNGIQPIKFGLIGKSLSHSFSPEYFSNKFQELSLTNYEYNAYEIADIAEVIDLKQDSNIVGLNVTIPYKEAILPYMDFVAQSAYDIGAINTIKNVGGLWYGYNTDYLGFKDLLYKALFDNNHLDRALILGNGGASKAVQYVLEQLKISYLVVSRRGPYTYRNISEEAISNSRLIINTTPLGMYPKLDECPNIDYSLITPKHSCIDLIYNPKKTLFLDKSESNGANIYNGMDMLISQAEHAWNIWNSDAKEYEYNGRPTAQLAY